jgi:hypothetical protein
VPPAVEADAVIAVFSPVIIRGAMVQ